MLYMWIYYRKNKKTTYKNTKKKNTNFLNRLTYAKPKIISIVLKLIH